MVYSVCKRMLAASVTFSISIIDITVSVIHALVYLITLFRNRTPYDQILNCTCIRHAISIRVNTFIPYLYHNHYRIESYIQVNVYVQTTPPWTTTLVCRQ